VLVSEVDQRGQVGDGMVGEVRLDVIPKIYETISFLSHFLLILSHYLL